MSEKIISIEEFSNFDTKMDGVIIVTSEQRIIMSIDNGQQCCETAGYFLSEDNISEFIGADLFNIFLTDTALNSHKMSEVWMNQLGCSSYQGDIIFVNIETSKGTLQFTAYNEHNGFYGHKVTIISNQVSFSDYI